MSKIDYSKEIEKYRPQLKAGERMKKYMAGETVDCIPHSIMRLENALFADMAYTTTDYNKNFEVRAEMIQRGIDDYGVGGLSVGIALRTLGASCGSVLSWPVHGFDHIEKFVLEDSLDISNLQIPDPRNNEILTPILSLAGKLKERFPNEALATNLTGPITAAVSFRPVEKLLKDTRKNPQAVKDLLEFCLEAQLKWAEVYVEEYGKVPTSIGDPVCSTDLLGPKQFDEFAFPYLERMVDGLFEITGYKPSLHICGHTKGIWDRLVKLNISSFSVDDIEDIGELKEAMGDKMLIVGNVPPTDILGLGTPEEVVESVKTCIKKAADSPKGYLINAGCALTLDTPKENLDAYFYAVYKYGAKAKLGEIPIAAYED